MDRTAVWNILQGYHVCSATRFLNPIHRLVRKSMLLAFLFAGWTGELTVCQPADSFNLTLSVNPAEGGTLIPASGTYRLKRDSVIALVAQPATGYRFLHWSKGVADSLAVSTSVALDTNKLLTAYFDLIPSLTTTSPNGGEVWLQGSTQTLTWVSAGISDFVSISFSSNGGSVWNTVTGSTANDGIYEWTVPNTISTTCQIRIADTSGSPADVSDAVFSIALAPVDQHISLSSGWNLFSLNVVPENLNMLRIVRPLIDRVTLIKVQDMRGNSIERHPITLEWLNDIGNWNPAEGYRINLNGSDDLVVHGMPVVDPVSLVLSAGWNILGYPFQSPVNATEALAGLMASGALQKVQDETGYSLEQLTPLSEWINNIGTLDPGEGYQVRVNMPYEFTFTPLLLKSALASYHRERNQTTVHFMKNYTGNGLNHMNIYLSDPVSGLPLEDGDEIGVFDGECCVGSLLIDANMPENISMVASADDPSTQVMDGFRNGNPLEIRIWKNRKQEEVILKNYESYPGDDVFHERKSLWVTMHASDMGDAIPPGTLGHPYPNPFANLVNVPFSLESDGIVDISVFNTLGAKVENLIHAVMPRGNHIAVWEPGKEGKQVPAGLYYVITTFRNHRKAEKVSFIPAH